MARPFLRRAAAVALAAAVVALAAPPVRSLPAGGILQLTNAAPGLRTKAARWQRDNRGLVFTSAGDLLPGENPALREQIFRWTDEGGLEQVTPWFEDGRGEDSGMPAADRHGTRIAFSSNGDFVGANTEHAWETYFYDRGEGFAQVTDTGYSLAGAPVLSDRGNRMAISARTDITGENPDGNNEIFLWDPRRSFRQVTVALVGLSEHPSISARGDVVVFQSFADLAGDNEMPTYQVFLLKGRRLRRISTDNESSNVWVRMDRRGRRFAWVKALSPTVSQELRVAPRVIAAWSPATGEEIVVSLPPAGGYVDFPQVDGSGRRILFISNGDLTGDNPQRVEQLFLVDEPGRVITQVTHSTGGDMRGPGISDDGLRGVVSCTGDLAGENPDGGEQLFLLDLPPLPPRGAKK